MISLLRLFWETTKWGLGRTPGPSIDAALRDKR